MSDYKLTYFQFSGGRGEPVRIALHAAGIAFEDVRWSFPEFSENHGSFRFGAIPALEIDGQVFTQSNAISRYVGKMAGLYPEDPLQALYCDEVLDALEDITHYLVRTFGLQGEELKAARETFIEQRLTKFLKGFEELLVRGGGDYFADQRLTIADLKMMVLLKGYRSGTIDHVPQDFIDQLTPAFVPYLERMEKEPVVAAYYASLA